ncbi:hypothetical protein PIB30_088173 [Stylosanthes scabra]|uniref:Putative plant transposon protein domain-containing protein n=1 Tax=Stylosanthes scabra TaxID=79078 RepID=A0ABU6ZS82_9FABA|nr:hypothetical protein [Stylosanthes scabra]
MMQGAILKVSGVGSAWMHAGQGNFPRICVGLLRLCVGVKLVRESGSCLNMSRRELERETLVLRYCVRIGRSVRGRPSFTIHSLVPTGNKSEITVARAIPIHSIMKGEEVRVENIIADNIAVISQGVHGKGKLGFPSTIYKLCKDARVPMREFKRTSRIPQEKPITAKRIETTRLPGNVPQQQDEDDEDEPMPQAGGGNEGDQDLQQYHQFQQPPQ